MQFYLHYNLNPKIPSKKFNIYLINRINSITNYYNHRYNLNIKLCLYYIKAKSKTQQDILLKLLQKPYTRQDIYFLLLLSKVQAIRLQMADVIQYKRHIFSAILFISLAILMYLYKEIYTSYKRYFERDQLCTHVCTYLSRSNKYF